MRPVPPFEELRPDLVAGRAEVVMSCLPERVGTAMLSELAAAGLSFSVLGGALLTRYLLPMYPLVLLLAIKLGGQLDVAIKALEKELDALHAAYPKPMIFTEFGAEALAGSHSTPPEMWTEEYQAEMISRYLDVAAARSYMAGTLMWCFADFKTSQSIIRTNSMNNKGVFTRDRRPKQAARMLRERWRGKGA